MALLPFEFADLRDLGAIVFNSAMLAVGFSIGMLARSWAGYRDRIARSAADRAVAEERASRGERARIARELHDVIAHTITVIVMQAGGARLASVSDPAIAATTLAQIEDLGRASLTELRSLLPLLRDGADEPATVPQPTLSRVGVLCERMRGLGLPVTLQIEGDITDVPLGLQLTGYRVVQEGLTNVAKHTVRADAAVRIHRSEAPAMLTVEVESRDIVDEPGIESDKGRLVGAGRGLVGIEERVRLAGGKFHAGRFDGSSFLLRVELPLTRELA